MKGNYREGVLSGLNLSLGLVSDIYNEFKAGKLSEKDAFDTISTVIKMVILDLESQESEGMKGAKK